MNNFKSKFYNFMSGRYGTDNLNKLLFWLTIVCLVFAFFGVSFFRTLYWLFLIIYLYRAFSKNYNQRYQENQQYLKHSEKLRWRIAVLRRDLDYRKTHKIFKCDKCRKKLSVPKGKGNIEISCPCGNKIKKKS